MIYDGEYRIYYIALPTSISGITVQDAEGFYSIYINCNIGIEEQREALEHEFVHIERGDFYRLNVSLEEIENVVLKTQT